MNKLLISIRKESLILFRDWEGLLLLFIMPIALVFIVTLLQESTYRNIQERNIPVVFADADKDSVGVAIREGFEESGMFEITVIEASDSSVREKISRDVASGKYQIGIFVPPNTTKHIKTRVNKLISQQLPGSIQSLANSDKEAAEISLYFDPITKESFRNLVRASLNQYVVKIEREIIFLSYSKVIDVMTNQYSSVEYPEHPVISFNESEVSEITAEGPPNSVQHNVPAWTLFAMFFVCIPLAGSIIRERDLGCMLRLKTIPVSYFTIILGKNIVYAVICLLQAVIIFGVGYFVLPMIGLPELQFGDSYASLALIVFSSSLAATSFGIVLGTFAFSYVQSSTLGAIFVVIMAALGGVWVPIYLMSDTMRVISSLSPMNWGLEAYYIYFLRNGSIIDVLPNVLKLLIFFTSCILVSILRRR